MTTPINLGKVRKAKARAAKTQSAAENRIKFGRTKAQKEIEKARADKSSKHNDDHRLD